MENDIVENILKERYYQPGETCWKDISERVANALFDKIDEKNDNFACREYLNNKEFIFNSPTLMNAGTEIGQLSACISGDTYIYTSTGLKKMEDIEIGDYVLTHKGRYKPVINKFDNGIKKTIGIFRGTKKKIRYSLRCTPDHLLLSDDNKWIRSDIIDNPAKPKLLKCDMLVEKFNLINYAPISKWGVNPEVDNGYIKYKNKSQLDHPTLPFYNAQINAIKDEIINDSDMAYLFGLYLSNGSLDENVIRFCINIKDKKVIKFIEKISFEKFGLVASIIYSNHGKWVTVVLNSKILVKLFEYEFGKGFKYKRIPEWIVNCPKKYKLKMLTGIMEDGFIKSCKTGQLILANPTLVYQSLLLARDIGFLGNFTPHAEVKLSKNLTSKMIYGNTKYLENVNRIELDECRVYDIEVEEDHSYIAGDFIVHNCFTLPIKDDMSDIYDTIRKSALIFQSGGGVGINWSTLRPEGSLVKSSGGTASGPLAFMQSFDAMVETVKSAGKRRGAAIAILNDDHPDIFKFITAKNEEGKLSNFNISIMLSDAFMEAVELNNFWDLNFGDVKYKTIKARDLFYEICKSAWIRAEPGVLFYDIINKDNPMKDVFGDITTCNPCVSGNTYIKIKDGKNILDVHISDVAEEEITIWNGFEWSKVTPKVTGYNKEMAEVTITVTCSGVTTDSTIRCTLNHHWIMFDGKRLKTSELENGFEIRDWKTINGETVNGTIKNVSIKDGDVDEVVYCLEEPKAHSFIANGVLTGNCSEQPLCVDFKTGGGEACVLGSIDVSKFTTDDGFVDFIGIEEVVRFAVRALDRIVDINKYPLPEIRDCVMKGRKIGLGVMGFADLLIKKNISYGSEESLQFIDELMSCIRKVADLESEHIGNGKKKNACTLTVAPTGSLALFANCSSGIEPNFGWVYNRSTWVDGEKKTYKMVHPLFEKCFGDRYDYNRILDFVEKNGTLKGYPNIHPKEIEVFYVAKDISPLDHVRVQAKFQQYVDASISKTVNCPNSTTIEDIYNIYMEAWKSGCKGITIYREGSRNDVVLESVKKTDVSNIIEIKNPVQYKLITANSGRILPKTPRECPSTQFKRNSGCGHLIITIGEVDGKPHTVTVENSGSGGCTALQKIVARLIALALRWGIPTWDIFSSLNMKCDVAVKNKKSDGISCGAIIGHILKEFYPYEEAPPKTDALEEEQKPKLPNVFLCPDCKEPLVMESGCVSCKSCGYSKCN